MTHPLKLCTFKELNEIYGISYCRQHIWRLEKLGQFPLRIRLGNRRISWLCVEIEKHIIRDRTKH
jgi:predicted DNA-binding transcriptional regulator AlpA